MNCTLCSSNDTEFKFIYTGTDLYLKKIGVKFDLNWYSCNSCKVYFSKQYSDIESVYEDEMSRKNAKARDFSGSSP